MRLDSLRSSLDFARDDPERAPRVEGSLAAAQGCHSPAGAWPHWFPLGQTARISRQHTGGIALERSNFRQTGRIGGWKGATPRGWSITGLRSDG